LSKRKRFFAVGVFLNTIRYNNQEMKSVKLIIAIILPTVVVFTLVQAGSLSPATSPGTATSYTLSDIYNRLVVNTGATAGNHNFAPTTTPQSTFHTLTAIYDAIPTFKSGESAASSTATSTTKLILTPPPGYYNGTTATVSTTSSGFIATNIKSGAYLFGLVGTLIEASGNAGFGDVLATATFSSSTAANVTGTIPVATGDTVVASSSAQSTSLVLTVPQGYYSGANSVTVSTSSANFTAANIKSGSYIFGLTGSYTVSAAGYPGTGWTGGTTITQTTCDAQNPNWYWFADANGDGDTTDSEDGICVQAAAVTTSLLSWNGSEQIAVTATTSQAAAAGGSLSTLKKATADMTTNYADMVVKIASGAAANCWGVVKSNTLDTITVYGSWLSATYASNCGTPDETSIFFIEDDGFAWYDNSWIGDWNCTPGTNALNGTVSWGSYPTAAKAGSGNIALAKTDCYDGVRDLLPTEASRAVKTGTATATSTTSITDSSLVLNPNAWVGQKVLITGGTGSGGSGRIESNTTTVITVDGWTAGSPDTGSTFAIVYLIPHATNNPNSDVDGNDDDELNGNNGPLTEEVLTNWKGSRLPTAHDLFGYCGYKDGGNNYENTANASSSDKTFGNYGGQAGRTDEFIDLANNGNYEWLSEQHNHYSARNGGAYACSYFNYSNVYSGNRFRAVFRP